MKFNILKNEERKSVTLVIGGVKFYSVKYLLERYENERYFGNGIIEATKEDFSRMMKELIATLNEINPNVKVTTKQLFENDDLNFPLFKKHRNKNDELTEDFEVVLTSFSKNKERDLFFADLTKTRPIRDEETIKGHEWGVELEITSRRDEDTNETKIFSILHRIIKGKKREGLFSVNDNAWGGFDLDTQDDLDELDEFVDLDDLDEDDLPF